MSDNQKANIKQAINEVAKGAIQKWNASALATMVSGICFACVRDCKQVAIEMGAKA